MSPIILLILFSLIGGVAVIIAGKKWASYLGLSFSVISLLYFLFVLVDFDSNQLPAYVIKVNWIPELNLTFHLGIDAQNILLLLLSFLVMPIGIIASMLSNEPKPAYYYALMLWGLGALIGFFTAQNPVSFYVFFELALIPFYLLVLMHGGSNRRQSVFKFFIYTVFGSFLMLAAIIFTYSITGGKGSELDWSNILSANLEFNQQLWVLIALFLAFAIKSPLFPFHTWQADLYSEGDRPVIIIIAGVLSKMGVFGLIRFYPLVGQAIESYKYILVPLCLIGIIYGALIAWRQSAMTRILAYSSLSHMGMIAAAIFAGTATALQGSIFQMFTHGILAASLFFVVDMIVRRTNNPSVYGSSGMASENPRLAAYFFIIVLASVGLPLTNGFIGEFYMLWGIAELNIWYGAIAGVSIILGAIYMLRFYQKSMFGVPQAASETLKSPLVLSEDYVMVVVIVLIFSFGFLPGTWMDLSMQAVSKILIK